MNRLKNLPKWAKLVGLVAFLAAGAAVVGKVAQNVSGGKLSPEKLRAALQGGQEEFQAAWDELMANRR